MKVSMSKSLLMTALMTGSLMSFGGAAFAAEDIQEYTLDTMVVTATRYEKPDVDIAADTQVLLVKSWKILALSMYSKLCRVFLVWFIKLRALVVLLWVL